MCAGVGITVSLFTKPESDKKLKGLTIFDAAKLKGIYKGSQPNEEIGENIIVDWKLNKQDQDGIQFSKNDMDKMKANAGDLIYIQDARWGLGGLKSAHSVLVSPHNEDGVVFLNSSELDHGQFLKGMQIKAEKEM